LGSSARIRERIGSGMAMWNSYHAGYARSMAGRNVRMAGPGACLERAKSL